LRKIKALVKKRQGIYVGKWSMKKPQTFQVENVKPPSKDWIMVTALYNPYPNCVRYVWFEQFGDLGKRLGVPTVGYYDEDSPSKGAA
jgi:hypothetical protein